MIYRDTRDLSHAVDFRTAVLNGMNEKTGGLYVPETIPRLSKDIIGRSIAPSFRDVALESAKLFVEDEIPNSDLQDIIIDSYPFSAQILPIDRITYVMELFHGPTCI